MEKVKAFVAEHIDTRPKQVGAVIITVGVVILVAEGFKWLLG